MNSMKSRLRILRINIYKSNIPHFQPLIQFGCSLNRKREHIVLTKEETEAFRIKLEPVIDK